MDANGNFEYLEHEGAFHILSNLDCYIDSLQEDPVSEDLLSKVDKQAKCIWDEINTGHEYSIIDSYNQFYSICMQIAESIKEEPVSEEWIEEFRTKLDSMSKEDFKKVFDKYAIDFNEDPVSEELEAAVDTYLATYWDGEKEKQDWPFLKKMAIYFAKWQKEQMMKDAIDTTIKQGCTNLGILIKGLDEDKFSSRDKVKVIIIKED